jgi:hypothetical protein
MMEPQATAEEEFNDWYDTEHLPERAGCPGFLTAQRYVCLDGWPRYLAFYDLETVQAVHAPAYRAFTGPNLGPWSRRVLGRVLGEFRAEANLVYPEDAVSLPKAERGRLLLLRFASVAEGGGEGIVKGLRERFEARPEVRRLRVFRGHDTGGIDWFGVVELAALPADLDLDLGTFGPAAGRLVLRNLYTAYWRKGHDAAK